MTNISRSRSCALSLWLAAICLGGPVYAQQAIRNGQLFMEIEDAKGSMLIATSNMVQGESGWTTVRGIQIGPPIPLNAWANPDGSPVPHGSVPITVTVDWDPVLLNGVLKMASQRMVLPEIAIFSMVGGPYGRPTPGLHVTLKQASFEGFTVETQNGALIPETTLHFTVQSITVGAVGAGASAMGGASAPSGAVTSSTPATTTVPSPGAVGRPTNVTVPAGVACTPRLGHMCPPSAAKPFSLPGYGKPTNPAGPHGG